MARTRNPYARERRFASGDSRRCVPGPPVAHFDTLTRVASSASKQGVMTVPRGVGPTPPELVYCQPQVDGKARVAVKRAATRLGWDAKADLAVHIAEERVTVALLQRDRALTGAPADAQPGRFRRRLDRQGRLQLSPAMMYALSGTPRSRVQVVADVATGVLTLAPITLGTGLLHPTTGSPEGRTRDTAEIAAQQ